MKSQAQGRSCLAPAQVLKPQRERIRFRRSRRERSGAAIAAGCTRGRLLAACWATPRWVAMRLRVLRGGTCMTSFAGCRGVCQYTPGALPVLPQERLSLPWWKCWLAEGRGAAQFAGTTGGARTCRPSGAPKRATHERSMPDDARAGQPGRAAAHRRFVIFPRRRIEASHSYLGVPRAPCDAPEAPRRACTGIHACHHVDEHIVRFKYAQAAAARLACCLRLSSA